MNKELILKVSRGVLICSLFIIGIIFFIFDNPKPIILGYVFGASISVLSFYLLNDSASKLVLMEPSAAKRKAHSNYILRYSIYFIVLLVSAVADYLNPLAAFLGLTMVKNSIYLLAYFDKDFLK